MKQKAILKAIKESLSKAERPLIRDFGEILDLQNAKHKLDIFVDKSINRLFENLNFELMKARPSFGIVGGELKSESWMIDFVGREYFKRGLNGFAVVIAYVCNNQVEIAYIRDPYLNETYYAELDIGGFYENMFSSGSSRMKVSGRLPEEGQLHLEAEFNELLKIAYLASGRCEEVKGLELKNKYHKMIADLFLKESGKSYNTNLHL